jgi:methyl-accepting chemotaxis protein
METGMRGYLLAGKEEFLDPYKGGQKRFFEQIKNLKNTVNDNPAQAISAGSPDQTRFEHKDPDHGLSKRF